MNYIYFSLFCISCAIAIYFNNFYAFMTGILFFILSISEILLKIILEYKYRAKELIDNLTNTKIKDIENNTNDLKTKVNNIIIKLGMMK